MFISSAFAQTAAGGDTTSTLMNMLPMVLMFVPLWCVHDDGKYRIFCANWQLDFVHVHVRFY